MTRPDPASPAAGGARLRGSVLAGFTALLTAVGHVAGGGELADLALLAVLLPVLAWPLIAVADRCRGPLTTTAVLGAGQFALHHLMTAAHSHHSGHGAVLDSAGMVAMHAAVTLLSVVGLRFADRGIAAVGAALRRVVPRRPLPPVVDRPPAVPVVPGPEVPARLRRVLAATHVRRGPPVCC